MTDDTTNGRVQWGALMRHLLGLQAQEQDQGQPNIPGSLPYGPTSPTVDNRYLQDNNARQVASAYGNAQDISPMARALMHPSPQPPQPLPSNQDMPAQGPMSPPPMGPGRDPGMGAPPPTGPYDGDQPPLADRASGNQGALMGAFGPQPGDDAPNAPVPMAKPKRGGGKAKGKAPATAPQPAWNERSAYDGEATEPPTPSQGDMDAAVKAGYGPTPTPEDMEAATKVHPQAAPAPGPTATPAAQGSPQGPGILSKIGGALSAALHNEDLGDILSGVSTGLLLGRNVKEGTGIGLQMADARIYRRRQMEQEQHQFDARMGLQNRGLDIQQRGQDQSNQQFGQELGLKRDQMGQQGQQFDQQMGLDRSKMGQQADQFGQSLGVQKDDLALRRDENALMSRHQAQQLALQERELGERSTNDAASRALQKQQVDQALEIAKMGDANHGVFTGADGGAIPYRETKDGRIMTMQPGSKDWQEGVPDGASSGISAVTPRLKGDEQAYEGLMTSAASAPDRIDQMQAVMKEVQGNPAAFGPSVKERFVRSVGKMFGLEGADSLAKVQQATRAGELDQAMAKMTRQGQITEGERAILRQSLLDPETMSADVIQQLGPKFIARAQEDMTLASKAKDRPKDKRFSEWEMEERMGLRNQNGGPMGGQKPPAPPGGQGNSVSIGGKTINYTQE